MGCFCSCLRVPDEEENYDVVVSNNQADQGDVSNKQNCAPIGYLTQIFKSKYGVVSGDFGLQTIPASGQGTYIATREVGTNTPQVTLLENSSSSGNLVLPGYVAVVRRGVGLGRLQLQHGAPERHIVQVKGPQGTLLQNSSSSRNLESQGHVAVQENGTGSGPSQLEHGRPEGHNMQVNPSSKRKDKVNLRSKIKDNAGGFSKDNKAEARCSASPANVSTEKVETEHKDYFCVTRDEIECPTCLEEYTDENPKITLKCNHHFHLGCIYEWMERSTNCPICSEEMKFAENI